MGFGSFITHLVAPALKLAAPIIRNPIVQLVAPPLALASLATGGGVLGFGAKHSSMNAVQPVTEGNVLQPQSGPTYYYGAPSYQAPSYQPSYSYGEGGPSWAYSTPSETFLTPQFQTSPVYSQPPPTSRTWEDLLSLGAAFL